MPKLKMGKLCAYVVTVLFCGQLTVVGSQKQLNLVDKQRPCDNAIGLPNDDKCLVPIENPSTWIEASQNCEQLGGFLYESPDADISSRPGLIKCLSALSDSKYDKMWINAVGKWSPHFIWINGTWVNKVDYCVRQQPRRDSSMTPIYSNTLSVDYCVSTCHDIGARFIVLHNSKNSPECYCIHELPALYQQHCITETVDFSDRKAFYIVHSKEDSLIKISNADAFTRTEILCATVDSTTLRERQMKSGTCFTKNQFICCLGEADKCVNTSCDGDVCRFHMLTKCMLRVTLYRTWYAARAYCVNLGGDLWNMHEFNEMTQVNQYLEDGSSYWIGATNYGWTFNGTSSTVANLPFDDDVRTRCGLMFRQTDSSTSSTWQWSDAQCTQKSAFLCQFNKTDFTQDEMQKDVICPWPMPVDPVAPVTDPTGNFTGLPITQPLVDDNQGGGSFPNDALIGVIIAAIIAGIILLTCMGLAFAWCSRSYMAAGGFTAVRERLAFIPYFANIPYAADYEGHAAMSSVSEHGSQVGLVKGEYQSAMSGYAMSSSYAGQNGMFASNSQSMDRRQQESIDNRFGRSQNYIASGSSSAADREFAAASSTMSANTRDYMTLQAQMSILDDAELAALRESFRRKPEVSLVTDNVDMNFTVNHAVSQGHSMAGSSAEMGARSSVEMGRSYAEMGGRSSAEMGRSFTEGTVEGIILPVSDGGITINLMPSANMASSSAEMGQSSSGMGRSYSERTVEGIILPVSEGGITLNLPDRVMEEARIYSTLKSTYNV